MVQLDTKAYITDDRSNGTTATASTREAHVVKVSFWLANPPTVSHLCVHCPGLKVTDFVAEPAVVCSEKNIAILLISFSFPPSNDPDELGFSDFFVYRAHSEHPSLDRLPSPHLRFLYPQEVGLLPCLGDGDDEFVLATLSSRLNPREYDLHMYVSKTGRWSTKLVLLESPPANSRDALLLFRTDKTITLEGGSMAWVNLWRGALLCNVFDENPVVRYIRFPRPANGNKANSKEKCAQLYRDVTYTNNLLKFIEVEPYKRPDICQGLVQPDINVFSDEDYEDDLDTTATRTWYGWKASIWSRKASSTSWYRGFTVDVDEIVISDPTHSDLLPELTVGYPGKSTLQNRVTSSPILRIQGDDVVYLMSKVNFEDEETWVIGVDIKTKNLRGVASFSTDRSVYSSPAYLPCSLSGYLDMTSNSSDGGCNTHGRNDLMNIGNGTTIVVSGLDACITEDD
ncbi:uncharacterized protein LOC100834137 isoform X1 [Brachypodium distachyon]|uniref:DUF1618 domain-containing protein n=1 Tax=Brachypodium distachyon TaxID=15368 RepID=A0A0Q3K0H1_BRADI|nr:uncharacterized protein LOC100834137 isoform X1 [Brachypodium distachyon]KQK23307.1 hypothetical protein BRADI_1g72580v3 [Brachypodium distachyon]|eukprot:XP_014756776.1 uncharacterized protein LOC100834137 isoform X1 [Brachypodium distachyon]